MIINLHYKGEKIGNYHQKRVWVIYHDFVVPENREFPSIFHRTWYHWPLLPFLVTSHLIVSPMPPLNDGFVLCDTMGCRVCDGNLIRLLVWKNPWSLMSLGFCLWGVNHNLKVFQKYEDWSVSLSTQAYQNWKVNWIRVFKTQVLDSYHPEALRFIRANGPESNISKNKINWGQIIYLGVWYNFILYCSIQYMATYSHIHSYSMIFVFNTKVLFSKYHTIHFFVQMEVSWCIYLCWYQFSLITIVLPTQETCDMHKLFE